MAQPCAAYDAGTDSATEPAAFHRPGSSSANVLIGCSAIRVSTSRR
ncbi:MAG: hypothetical protein NTU53_19360 [Planctomycetota bacterium]|nr:hypothetical protein [Planctomycetota bacterium]